MTLAFLLARFEHGMHQQLVADRYAELFELQFRLLPVEFL